MDEDRWRRKQERYERRMDDFERRWERRRHYRHSPTGSLFGGIVLLTIGGLFLLNNMGMLDGRPIARFWPVLLIALGVFRIVESGDDYRHSSGVFWIVVGGLFLTGTLGFLRISMGDLVPVVLIGLGALMLWRRSVARPGGRDRESEPVRDLSFSSAGDAGETKTEMPAGDAKDAPRAAASPSSLISATAILGGVERRSSSQDFRGGSVTSFMGGCWVDLRSASIVPPNEPVLEVFAMFGGIEISVPPDWTVVSRVDPILGGFEDSTQAPKEESKRLIVRGTVLMGGLEVKN
jgi:predicted membrane protein